MFSPQCFGESNINTKLTKWNEAYQDVEISTAAPAAVLRDNAYLLPQSGDALDLACGRAGNSIFLAKKGFQVDATDISPVVLQQVQTFADKHNLPITCKERDIEKNGLENDGLENSNQYDVIIVSYFLNRELFPKIIKALKPNGILFYQTWSQLRTNPKKGPSNPSFCLESGELLKLCTGLRIIYYREDGLQGDADQGIRNEALFIGQNIS